MGHSSKLKSGSITPKEIMTKILTLHKHEFPNVCMLGEIMLSISGFNWSVKWAFSILNLIINDCRMKQKHSVIQMLIWIKGNDFTWSDAEHDDTINNTVDIYIKCYHKTKLYKPVPKKKK